MNEQKGLVCARCGCRHFEVVYTRPAADNRIMRRRACRHCGKRITTFEQNVLALTDPPGPTPQGLPLVKPART